MGRDQEIIQSSKKIGVGLMVREEIMKIKPAGSVARWECDS